MLCIVSVFFKDLKSVLHSAFALKHGQTGRLLQILFRPQTFNFHCFQPKNIANNKCFSKMIPGCLDALKQYLDKIYKRHNQLVEIMTMVVRKMKENLWWLSKISQEVGIEQGTRFSPSCPRSVSLGITLMVVNSADYRIVCPSFSDFQ